MFAFSSGRLLYFSFFFGSHTDLLERRSSIPAQGVLGLTVWNDLHRNPGQGWPQENKLH